MKRRATLLAFVLEALFLAGTAIAESPASKKTSSRKQVETADLVRRLGAGQGICVLLDTAQPELPVELARSSNLIVFVQLADAQKVKEVRKAADEAGLLGSRIYVRKGSIHEIFLADNMADAMVVSKEVGEDLRAPLRKEILRVLRPGGIALIGSSTLVKPQPNNTDNWGHPYHGPDNNPRSLDQVARAPYLTQFLAKPWYGPMPEVTVAAGGRIFKAFGHIAFKERETPLLNTLVAMSGFNGTLLWKRKLSEGFMVHRNTMIATPKVLYLADDVSCKLIDTTTGKITSEIVPPSKVTADKVWKWMALQDGVLYALLGPKEHATQPLRGRSKSPGWPWGGLGRGYGQSKYPWGFGNVLLALDPKTQKVLWSHKETEPLDSRALCMNQNKIFFYSHQKFLGCLDAQSGQVLWKTSDKKLLQAIGQHDRAQTWRKGFSSTSYVKCNRDAIYFAGPQRNALAAASAADGKLLWQYPHGNYQLVLFDDALYAMGKTETSRKFDLLTGKMLADLKCRRGNCTRATATIDSIFTRGDNHSGTQRIVLQNDRPTRIGVMRPACQDGVVVSDGLMYWGPWMCDCNLSLVGIVCLGPAGDFDFTQKAVNQERLETYRDASKVAELKITDADWPTYRGDNARHSGSPVSVAKEGVKQLWQFVPSAKRDTTAPVAAGSFVFVSGSDGAVRALSAASGKEQWRTYTGGAVRYPPALDDGRVFVGSYDGFVYAFEAATGRRLWRFRAAPRDRTISIYGRLGSTWPVATGALVDDGVVFAAAGIASFDGTHVYALYAESGEILWQNNTSGSLFGKDVESGVSVQGHLLLDKDKLYMAGGNVVSPAVYDANNGKCLNKFQNPSGKSPRGRELFLVNHRVVAFDRLLYSPDPYQKGRYHSSNRFGQASLGDVLVRSRPGRIVRVAGGLIQKSLWENRSFTWIDAMAVTQNAVLVTGKMPGVSDNKNKPFALAALDVATGKVLWSQSLPSSPASWGLAVNRDGKILVTLADGRLVCYGK